MEKTYGIEQLEKSMITARERVIRYYDRAPAPVIDTTITDLMRLLNANSYQKGAWVLHMLRFEIGEDVFWKGIRLFYEKYRYGNALTADFRQVMEFVSGRDLRWFFHQWLYVAGQPDLKINTGEGNEKGTIIVSIEQMQDHLFTFNLELGLKDSNGTRNENIRISEKLTRVSFKADPDVSVTIDPEVRLLFTNN
jgi:aminopeptidase N